MGDQTQIYFFLAAELNVVKIGISVDVGRRLREVATTCPVAVEEFESFPGTLSDERWLHERLAHKRRRGEWFAWDEETEDVLYSFGNGFIGPGKPDEVWNR